jgi:hypothetical protein
MQHTVVQYFPCGQIHPNKERGKRIMEDGFPYQSLTLLRCPNSFGPYAPSANLCLPGICLEKIKSEGSNHNPTCLFQISTARKKALELWARREEREGVNETGNTGVRPFFSPAHIFCTSTKGEQDRTPGHRPFSMLIATL